MSVVPQAHKGAPVYWPEGGGAGSSRWNPDRGAPENAEARQPFPSQRRETLWPLLTPKSRTAARSPWGPQLSPALLGAVVSRPWRRAEAGGAHKTLRSSPDKESLGFSAHFEAPAAAPRCPAPPAGLLGGASGSGPARRAPVPPALRPPSTGTFRAETKISEMGMRGPRRPASLLCGVSRPCLRGGDSSGPSAPPQGKESRQVAQEMDGTSRPLLEASAGQSYDYVLVAPLRALGEKKRQQFLEELGRKGFQITEKQDEKRAFSGIRANDSIFSPYHALMEDPDPSEGRPSPIRATTRAAGWGSPGQGRLRAASPEAMQGHTERSCSRIRVVHSILQNIKTPDGDSFDDLVKQKIFEVRFPLHKEEEKLKGWATWKALFKPQPADAIDAIRDYFGEKAALYFAWLGWYTCMLVPAALMGLLIFLSGFSLFNTSQISKEICAASDIYLCPRGDHNHNYQRLSDTCTFAKLTHLFDNEGTVLFAIFMALWGDPSPAATVFLEFWKRKRAQVVLHWDLYGWDEDQAGFWRNREEWPSRPEKPRTFSEEEGKFTVKFFTLQFFAHFSSLIYTAFILGRINGHPGNSVRLAGLWKLEEVMIQYGFTTTFVAAFPLAPLLALISNVVEIRGDAIKMARLQRRLVPRMAKDIGTWLQVLETIGVLAVIANGMVISFTSEFIPRLVYKYHYGPCRGGAHPEVDCLTGYVSHSLSVFDTKNLPGPGGTQRTGNVTECRYRDYRNAQDQSLSPQFWVLLAIRLAFLILFEHVALCIKLVAAWFVPDVPQAVKNEVLKEKFQGLHSKLRSWAAGAQQRPRCTTV
ncbi:PREDICTED: anoctamin-9 [Condylura cristata]|uniref:anoctamin-9 n=1 Tax=Condylura cristata TaxID=143302 RepID=UPI0006430E80|nr:PREDICTED: anoctamin-9 [Condylura cristata]